MNPHPGHAIRILKELAKYEINKTVQFNQIVLEAVERWLLKKDIDAHNSLYSPLDILDPFLEKSDCSTYLKNHSIISQPFVVSKERTQKIRDRALQLIENCANSEQLSVCLRAVKSLGKALKEPEGFFGQKIFDEQREQWVPEQLKVLEILSNIVKQAKNTIIHLQIIESIRWYVRANTLTSAEVKQKAQNILQSIPETSDLRLIRVLSLSYDRDLPWEDGEDFKIADRKWQQHLKEIRSDVAQEFLQKYTEAAEGVQVLNKWLQEIQNTSIAIKPWQFIKAIAEFDLNYAAEMCETLIKLADCPLAPYFASLLSYVRISDINRAIDLTKCAINTENPTLCCSVAGEYVIWVNNLQPDEREIIKHLLGDSHLETRRCAIAILEALGRLQPQLAIDMALTVDIGNHSDLASEFCQVFHTNFGIPPADITEEVLKTLLTKLEPVVDIERDSITRLLAYAFKRLPCFVVQLLLKRIERERNDENYEAIPSLDWHELEGLAENEEYENILREIRDRSLERTLQTDRDFSRLFREVSLGFNPTSLKVLNEWIDSGNRQKIEASSCLLGDPPSNFVFDNVEFTTNLLEKAYDVGDQCYNQVCCNLHDSVMSQAHFSIAGEPSPAEIALQEQASAIAKKLIVESPSHKFYESLVQSAKDSIDFRKKLDDNSFN